MRTVLAAVTACTIALGGACSSFTADDSKVTDSADAGDGALADAAPREDGNADAGASGPFCSGPPRTNAFCASFDEGNPASFDWDGPPIEGGNVTLEIVENVAGTPSMPGALRATVAQDTSADCFGQAQISKTLSTSTPFTKLHAEFMVKVDAVGARMSYARLSSRPLADAKSSWDVTLSHADSLSDYGEGWTPPAGETKALGQGAAFSRYLLPGRWTKVALDVTFAPPRFEVSFDGVSVASRDSVVLTVADNLIPHGATLTLGPSTGLCPSSTDISFDNVRLSLE